MTARADLLLSASQVAAVTGASARLQGQRYAHHIYTHSAGDSIPCGHGDDRYVTAETVYRIAITEACAKAGVHIRNAAKSALLFAEDQRGRHANTLYEFGRTLLVIKEGTAAIVAAQFDALLTDVQGRRVRHRYRADLSGRGPETHFNQRKKVNVILSQSNKHPPQFTHPTHEREPNSSHKRSRCSPARSP